MLKRIFNALVLFLCLTQAGVAQKGAPSPETLEDVTAVGERERQRRPPIGPPVENPNRFTVKRSDAGTEIWLEFNEPEQVVYFQRTSVARLPTRSVRAPMALYEDRLSAGDGPAISGATLRMNAEVEEADGLPALMAFDRNTSLMNVDYLRLSNASTPTIINLWNAIHLQTRKCRGSLAVAVDDQVFPATYILHANRLTDCQKVLGSREGDLLFAEAVPEQLRQQIRDLYNPLFSFFSNRLGSEPGLLFVVWRPQSSREDFQLVRSWNRTNVLILNGSAWSRDWDVRQQDALWEALSREQIERRLQWEANPNAFTQSAVDYLLQLSRLERKRAGAQQITELLPSWIADCAREWRSKDRPKGDAGFVYAYNCGALVQFAYDAVLRSRSSGDVKLYNTWRTLLDATAKRGEYGVRPEMFLSSSPEARTLTQGILNGSVQWPQFLAALEKYGVTVAMEAADPEPIARVKSVSHFAEVTP